MEIEDLLLMTLESAMQMILVATNGSRGGNRAVLPQPSLQRPLAPRCQL